MKRVFGVKKEKAPVPTVAETTERVIQLFVVHATLLSNLWLLDTIANFTWHRDPFLVGVFLLFML